MKIAFKLSTPEAVEYANGHRDDFIDFNDSCFAGSYFHIPKANHHSYRVLLPGYTDVTKDFKETYWRPWKDKLASVQNREVNVVATLGSGSGITDGQKTEFEEVLDALSSLVRLTSRLSNKTGLLSESDKKRVDDARAIMRKFYTGWTQIIQSTNP
jgi:hypothetical protein